MEQKLETVAFYTLGCKVNQYESEAISSLFEQNGYNIVEFEEKADVYVINTCTVTGLSARKSRQMIRRARGLNSDAIIAVIGCYSQTAPDEVMAIPGVNLVIGTKDRNKIIEHIRTLSNTGEKLNVVDNIMNTREFEELGIDTYKAKTRAFLKIQEGCSQFCTYCIIPYARGPVRSRDPKNIKAEVTKLAQNGFKEIVLTGIHLESYGKELKTTSLIEITKDIHEIEGIERIRLGSIEPNTLSSEFIKEAAKLPKLCSHFHVSLQSGCDETLKRMNRKYDTTKYKESLDLLRASIKDVAITTDVMVGFPGETEEEFEITYNFLKEIKLASMHVFKYSPRKGTPAADFPDQIKPELKDSRSQRLLELAEQSELEFYKAYVGRTMKVLFEQKFETNSGMFEGLTGNYIRVVCKGDALLEGKIVPVQLMEVQKDYIIGKIDCEEAQDVLL